jgi:hypothetical protein
MANALSAEQARHFNKTGLLMLFVAFFLKNTRQKGFFK